MFDPLDADQKKENMTLDNSLLILANIYVFCENDTNEVKGSYHDDCLEKKNKKKKQHILHSCQYMMSTCFNLHPGHRLFTYLFMKASSCQQL